MDWRQYRDQRGILLMPGINSIWRGRCDDDGAGSYRWHQRVVEIDDVLSTESFDGAPVLLGFACDEGVRRNRGRVGAYEGPREIRRALANLTCVKDFRCYDMGDNRCHQRNLEESQNLLAKKVCSVLTHQGFPILLGGGHEIAWASFLGAQQYLLAKQKRQKLGIINFDAHFDLRPASPPSSGSPFRQCHEFCTQVGSPFNYFVLGINPSANSQALFDYACAYGVHWVLDLNVQAQNIKGISYQLEEFIHGLDYLYLTICLDAFSACFAPGVSAPAAVGIHPGTALQLIACIKKICGENNVELLLCDVAEMNPRYDRGQQTAILASRLIFELAA